MQISGVFPRLSFAADTAPVRSESGIGALMPWADRLWAITYVSHGSGTGSGTGLFEIGEDIVARKRPESVCGTYANRLIHSYSNQCIIGPHLIDPEGNVRTIASLVEHRLTATMEHIEDPEKKVYFLTMEGLLFEGDVYTLETRQLFDLVAELKIPRGAQPHFKGGHTGSGRVVVANNTYDAVDYTGGPRGGRLAEWDGNRWTVLEETAFMDVAGRRNLGQVIFANGWDKASAILKVFTDGRWWTYRLPKGSHCYDHMWLTEWTRVREVETERYLMDCHGMFYELMPVAYQGKIWGLRPICTHLRIVPDFCSFRGLFVMAGNQVTPNGDQNLLCGQPQSGLWFGKTDDLWQFGKPSGWGGPWWDTPVDPERPSDPFLMTGFDKKVLHLRQQSDRVVEFQVEVDFLGDQTWVPYTAILVSPDGYVHHEFPDGFSAHWVRLRVDRPCRATAQFMYT